MDRLVYKGKILSVFEYTLKGKDKKRTLMVKVKENDAVVIIPVKSDGKVVLERQYRHVIGRWIYELPAGHVDKGESYRSAALRELKEETGYSARSMKRLFVGYPAPGTYAQKQVFFLASGLENWHANLEDDELIDVHELGLKKVLEMIKENRIIDSKTIAGVLYYSDNILKEKFNNKMRNRH